MSRKLARESSRSSSGKRFNNRSDSPPRRFNNRPPEGGGGRGGSESRFGDRPRPSYGRSEGRSFGDRPRPFRDGDSRPPRRDNDDRGFRPRRDNDSEGFRPPRRDNDDRGFRPPRRDNDDRGFRPRRDNDSAGFRPPRRDNDDRGFRPRRDNDDGGFRPPRRDDGGRGGGGGRFGGSGGGRGRFGDDRGSRDGDQRGGSRPDFRKSFDRGNRYDDRNDRNDRNDRPEGRGNKSRLPKNDGYYLYGFHSVVAALLNPAREKIKLHLTIEVKEKLEKNEQLKKLLAEMDLAVDVMDRHGLDHQFADVLHDAPHQGVVFETRPLPHVDLRHHLENTITIDKKESPSCFLVLDKLQDPHNIGAILRSARYFNIDGVVLPERHTAPESAVMAKSASGALETTPLIRVANLSEAIKVFKKHGFWIYGLNQDGAQPLQQTNFDKKSVLLLGQEGSGLSPLVNAQTDFSVKIDGGPATAGNGSTSSAKIAKTANISKVANAAADASMPSADGSMPSADGSANVAEVANASADGSTSFADAPNASADASTTVADSAPTDNGKPMDMMDDGAVNNVDSLNVSNATAVALYQWSISKGA